MRIGLYKKRADKKIYFFIIIAAVLYLCFLFFERVYPNYIARVDIYLNNAGNAAINSALSATMKSTEPESFDKMHSDSNGKISAINGNTYAMNVFKANYTDNLYKIVNQTEPGYIVMPIGSLSRLEILSGLGPKIRIKSQISGIIKCDFDDEFEACGINQVKHRIFMNVSVTFCAVSATMNRSQTINTIVPISETVIPGEVPKYYGLTAPFYADRE